MNNPFESIDSRLSNIECLLLDIKHSEKFLNTVNKGEDLPITISEASALTKLAVPTIYGLVHKRKIPSYRRGKRLYFLKSELLAWIKAGRQSTIQEIREDAQNSLIQDR